MLAAYSRADSIFIPAVETLRREDPFEGKFLFETVWFNTVLRDRYGERVNELDEWQQKTDIKMFEAIEAAVLQEISPQR